MKESSKASPKKVSEIYLIDPKISWKTFKLLQDKLVKDSGPVPLHGDKILWGMLRKREIYCWFDFDNASGDMKLGLELPKNKKIITISNGKWIVK